MEKYLHYTGRAYTPQKSSPDVATIGDAFRRTPIAGEDHPAPLSDVGAGTTDPGGVKCEPGHGVFGDREEKVRKMRAGATLEGERLKDVDEEEFGKGHWISEVNVAPTPTPTPAMGPVHSCTCTRVRRPCPRTDQPRTHTCRSYSD
jgi:hypothetical protein